MTSDSLTTSSFSSHCSQNSQAETRRLTLHTALLLMQLSCGCGRCVCTFRLLTYIVQLSCRCGIITVQLSLVLDWLIWFDWFDFIWFDFIWFDWSTEASLALPSLRYAQWAPLKAGQWWCTQYNWVVSQHKLPELQKWRLALCISWLYCNLFLSASSLKLPKDLSYNRRTEWKRCADSFGNNICNVVVAGECW